MPDSFYGLPIAALAAMTAVVFVGAYWAGCFLLRPFLRVFVRSDGGENHIVGTALSAFGVFYGLLLSLIAVAAYQNLNNVEKEVANEASTLLALHGDVADFSEPTASEMRALLRDYCRYAIDEEWPVQRDGRIPLGARPKLQPVRKALLSYEPSGFGQQLVHRQALDHFEAMLEHGRQRRYAAQTGIPSVMWYVVIVGTLINFTLLWLFDMRFLTQLFLGGLIAFFLGALILLIAVLDRPYRSLEFGVSPQALELVHTVMVRYDEDVTTKTGVELE